MILLSPSKNSFWFRTILGSDKPNSCRSGPNPDPKKLNYITERGAPLPNSSNSSSQTSWGWTYVVGFPQSPQWRFVGVPSVLLRRVRLTSENNYGNYQGENPDSDRIRPRIRIRGFNQDPQRINGCLKIINAEIWCVQKLDDFPGPKIYK